MGDVVKFTGADRGAQSREESWPACDCVMCRRYYASKQRRAADWRPVEYDYASLERRVLAQRRQLLAQQLAAPWYAAPWYVWVPLGFAALCLMTCAAMELAASLS